MALRSVRSAKIRSVDQAEGGRASGSCFFLPRLVVSFTSGDDEFHSLNTTPYPSALSHWCSRVNWVDFPDPSILFDDK